MDLCAKNGRRYGIVDFDGGCHNYRISIIKNIPSVKIRPNKHYIGRGQMVGCNAEHFDILIFELIQAKKRDGYCTYIELGYGVGSDMLRKINRYQGGDN